MALTQKLALRQGQSLLMTPQLQQAIKLLQMSHPELQAFVEGEIERNPLLERDDGLIAPEGGIGAEKPGVQSTEVDAADEVFSDFARGSASRRAGAQAFEAIDVGATIARQPSLAEHLSQQLNLAIADPAERLIGAHLIGMLNESGYLTGELESVAEALGAPLSQVERVLAVLQTFEPTGVFTRDLAECLALQLKERDRFDPAMAMLIEHLDLLAKRDLERLRKLCGVDLDDLKDMIAEIRRLDPRPGNAFSNVVLQSVIPDILVRRGRDGGWHVELNTETLPRVLINNRYHAALSRGARRQEDRLFISECHAKASWLLKSLDQRARTILAVCREIVRQQEEFLLHGVEALKPLNLRDIAEAIGMHESTVSRVSANKYMSTPRGTFEVKYFFATAIAAAHGGEAHSSHSVRHRIRELLAGERADKVLSDDMIAGRLRADGVEIARRTVAKYRESLGIPSSAERRRERRMAP